MLETLAAAAEYVDYWLGIVDTTHACSVGWHWTDDTDNADNCTVPCVRGARQVG